MYFPAQHLFTIVSVELVWRNPDSTGSLLKSESLRFIGIKIVDVSVKRNEKIYRFCKLKLGNGRPIKSLLT